MLQGPHRAPHRIALEHILTGHSRLIGNYRGGVPTGRGFWKEITSGTWISLKELVGEKRSSVSVCQILCWGRCHAQVSGSERGECVQTLSSLGQNLTFLEVPSPLGLHVIFILLRKAWGKAPLLHGQGTYLRSLLRGWAQVGLRVALPTQGSAVAQPS